MHGPVSGYSREGTILGYNPNTGSMRVALNSAQNPYNSTAQEIEVPLPTAWFGSGGEIGGMYPKAGSSVSVVRGQGGEWWCQGYGRSKNFLANNKAFPKDAFEANKLAGFRPGCSIMQMDNNIRQIIDSERGIFLGSPTQQMCIDPEQSLISTAINQNLSFSNATRSIKGIVKRDLQVNAVRNISGSALTSPIYESALTPIGLDPLTATGLGFIRNPPFVEDRQTVYEFAYDFGFGSDQQEEEIYETGQLPQLKKKFNRRESRADTLSLSLVAPNYLMEQTKGTVVDSYGNVLDINRTPLPVGRGELSLSESELNLAQTFCKIREIERKSVAYHFEINSRKPLPLPNINDPADYGRSRSRFFMDIDKEGQFSLNVPMSGPCGNVPLPLRFENYSTLYAEQNETHDPDAFIRNPDNIDLYPESYGIGVVALSNHDQEEGKASPIGRISEKNIKLGTPYHDLTQTAKVLQRADPMVPAIPNSLLNNQEATPLVTDIVTTNLVLDGPNANAGGRSGAINLDGFVSLSVGANTSDRQSLWMDYAGGVVANIGRDFRGRSYTGTMDGDFLLQIGGPGITTDSRFPASSDPDRNGVHDGTLDVRVVYKGGMSVFRISEGAVTVAAPGRVTVEAAQDIKISAGANLYLDAENIYMYARKYGDVETGRLVLRKGKLTIS